MAPGAVRRLRLSTPTPLLPCTAAKNIRARQSEGGRWSLEEQIGATPAEAAASALGHDASSESAPRMGTKVVQLRMMRMELEYKQRWEEQPPLSPPLSP